MNRRELLALAAVPATAMPSTSLNVRLGIDLFSLRSQKWTPFQYLDYCAARQVQVVHFSEIKFLGSLEPANLVAVREHASKLGLEIEIGMTSICPTSKMFNPSLGSAEQQLSNMIVAAKTIGSPIVRAVLEAATIEKTEPLNPALMMLFACFETFGRRSSTSASRSRLKITPATCRLVS